MGPFWGQFWAHFGTIFGSFPGPSWPPGWVTFLHFSLISLISHFCTFCTFTTFSTFLHFPLIPCWAEFPCLGQPLSPCQGMPLGSILAPFLRAILGPFWSQKWTTFGSPFLLFSIETQYKLRKGGSRNWPLLGPILGSFSDHCWFISGA